MGLPMELISRWASDPLSAAELALDVMADAGRRRRVAQRQLDVFRAHPNPRLWVPPKSLRTRVRCTARRTNGEPCKAWSVHGCWVCRAHGGAKTAVREAGQLRLFRLAVERQFRRAFDAGRLESWASDVAVLLTLSVADEDQP
jgi:hypothetical protein